MKKLLLGRIAAVVVLMVPSGCDQDKMAYDGPSYFMLSDMLYMYAVQETNEILNILISATVAADHDRTLVVEVTDRESNAVGGKHYKTLSNTVIIKAGERSTNLEVQGIYDNLEINDSLSLALRPVVPETEQWGPYGVEAKVVMQKIRLFDIKNFTGYCVVSLTYFANYLNNLKPRLVTSDTVEGKENTITIHGLYYDGYDTEITSNREGVQEPLVEMDEQLCASTATAFGTIYGDDKLLMNQPTVYASYFSTNENFVPRYVTLSVNNRDGSSRGTVGTFVSVIEWISEAGVEKLKEQGYQKNKKYKWVRKSLVQNHQEVLA